MNSEIAIEVQWRHCSLEHSSQTQSSTTWVTLGDDSLTSDDLSTNLVNYLILQNKYQIDVEAELQHAVDVGQVVEHNLRVDAREESS